MRRRWSILPARGSGWTKSKSKWASEFVRQFLVSLTCPPQARPERGTAILQCVLPFARKVGRPEQDNYRHRPNYEQRVYSGTGKPSGATGGGPEIVTTVKQGDHQNASARAVVQPREHNGQR